MTSAVIFLILAVFSSLTALMTQLVRVVDIVLILTVDHSFIHADFCSPGKHGKKMRTFIIAWTGWGGGMDGHRYFKK